MASTILVSLLALFVTFAFATKKAEDVAEGREPLFTRPDGLVSIPALGGLGSYPLNNIGGAAGYHPLLNGIPLVGDPSDFLRRSNIDLLPTQGRAANQIFPPVDPTLPASLNANILQLLLQQQRQQRLARQQLLQQQAHNSIQGSETPNILPVSSARNDPLMELMILQYILGNDGIQDFMKSLRSPLNPNSLGKMASYSPSFNNHPIRDFPVRSRQEDLLFSSFNPSILGQSTSRTLQLDTPSRQRENTFNFPGWVSSRETSGSGNSPFLQYQPVPELTSSSGSRPRTSQKSNRRQQY